MPGDLFTFAGLLVESTVISFIHYNHYMGFSKEFKKASAIAKELLGPREFKWSVFIERSLYTSQNQ